MSGKEKYILNMDERAVETIERLKKATDASCTAEVIRDAIGFYDWARQHVVAGRAIGAVNAEKTLVTEVILKFRKEP